MGKTGKRQPPASEEITMTTELPPAGETTQPVFNKKEFYDLSPIPLIYSQMAKIMAEVDPIGKNRTNQQGSGYKFRGIDDAYNALNPVMAKHGVFTTSEILSERSEERQTKSGGTLIYRIINFRWHFWAVDGSSVVSETIGEAMDSGDKASNKAMAVAHKYALLQVFCIGTEERKDTEYETHEVTPKAVPVITKPAITTPTASAFERMSPAPKSSGYDPQNRNHQDVMMKTLKSKNIPENVWDDIGNAMKGKGFDRLDSVIKQFKSTNHPASVFTDAIDQGAL